MKVRFERFWLTPSVTPMRADVQDYLLYLLERKPKPSPGEAILTTTPQIPTPLVDDLPYVQPNPRKPFTILRNGKQNPGERTARF